MGLQVVGAGLGRTGTNSLKVALEQLLGGPCYHMVEVFGRPDDPAVWADAYEGRLPDWNQFLADYQAAVDWPVSPFWEPLSRAFPDAVILLSTRDADSWWTSASNTIFQALPAVSEPDPDDPGADDNDWNRMARVMMRSFTPDWRDESAAKAAYLAHNEKVRATAPPDRLVEWHPGDGWEPICAALGRPAPDERFPHVNSTEDFRTNLGLDQS